jgi:Fic family protein
MNQKVLETHPHLRFQKIWDITANSRFLLGQCEAYVKAITNSPMLPQDHQRLLHVSLVKGALATTAIEGNTLTEEEVQQISEGKHLPPSKEYQEIEVQNIIDSLNHLFKEVVQENKVSLITPQIIKDFHRMIGKGLGEHFDAIPGQFRRDIRVVGTYRSPDYVYVDDLMEEFCEWLKREFHYVKGQEFSEVIIQAITAHVFLEWIHPFGDGNGRTGRLLEFYILLRGGNPAIASHILSNHYNETRSEYYRQLNKARQNRSLTEFIEYALLGLRDGLVQTLGVIQSSQFRIAWDRFVYDAFEKIKMKNKNVFKRRRKLMLSFPLNRTVQFEEIPIINLEIARMFSSLSERTINRDLAELINMNLLIREKDVFKANTEALRLTGHLPQSRQHTTRAVGT